MLTEARGATRRPAHFAAGSGACPLPGVSFAPSSRPHQDPSLKMARLPSFPADVTIQFDGRPIPARRGESVASALLAAGVPLASRSSKYHRPRGPFCL
ncbi:MAG TPA: (2Fe-2S)-binding protein, partial [Anaeromyxobacteraceae bacterium]|nr:(2Fe-2S)-binding protein [Anaeromyxobacteraceae bacterium]